MLGSNPNPAEITNTSYHNAKMMEFLSNKISCLHNFISHHECLHHESVSLQLTLHICNIHHFFWLNLKVNKTLQLRDQMFIINILRIIVNLICDSECQTKFENKNITTICKKSKPQRQLHDTD